LSEEESIVENQDGQSRIRKLSGNLSSRRRFLRQVGGAGLAALAAQRTATSQQPARGPAIPQISHTIVLMQENHSFDNYFGSYSGLFSGYGIPADYTSGAQLLSFPKSNRERQRPQSQLDCYPSGV
jgi:phospholipase C